MRKSRSDPGAVGIAAPTARSPMVDVFVGRDRERGALRAGLDSALAGRGRLFLISGEPGIGKSRLAEEFSGEAARCGMRVLWGRCWGGGGAPAYWPIIQILRGCAERPDFPEVVETLGSLMAPVAALVPEIVPSAWPHLDRSHQERVHPEEGRFRLFDGIATLLKSIAAREPLLVVIDDLHEADGSTLKTLRFLAREIKTAPLMLIGTHRLGEVERSQELRIAIGEIAREGSRVPLSGLTRSQIATMVRARSGLSPDDRLLSTLCSATDGNPLFLGGVLQSLIAEGKLEEDAALTPLELTLPVSIRAMIQKNFSLLSERTNSMLVNAAALGAEFAITPLAELAGASAQEVFDCLDEAAGLRVIVAEQESRGRYRFAHPLLREVLYENLSTARKFELHAKIAQLLESAIRSDPSPARLSELAHHCLCAAVASNPPSIERALEYSLRAGIVADNLCATQEAIALWEAGLKLPCETVGEETRARLLWLAANCRLFVAGLSKKAIDECEEAIDALDRLGLHELGVEARIWLALLFAKIDDENLTDVPRALKHIEHAARALERDRESELLPNLYYALMRASVTGLDTAQASEAYVRGIEISRRIGASLWEGYFRLLRRQLQAYAGQISDAVGPQADDVQPAANVANSLQQRAHQLSPAIFRAYQRIVAILIRWRIWDPAAVEEVVRDSVPEAVSANLTIIRRRGLLELAVARSIAGNLEAAGAVNVDEAPDTLAAAIVAFHEGDWDRAQPVFERGLARARAAGARQCEADWIFWYSRLLRVRGDTRRASSVLRDALRHFGDGSVPLVEMWFRPELVLSKAGDVDGSATESHLARCREILSSGEDWRGLEGAVIRAQAFAAAVSQGSSETEQGFERAIGIFQRYSLPWEEAETLQLWARVLDRAKEKIAAAEKLDAAIEIYRRLRAGPAWIDRALKEKRSATDVTSSAPQPGAGKECTLRREGEYWTIVYDGRTSRLKDSRGMNYIAHLISHPGQQLHVRELGAMFAPASDSSRLRLEEKRRGAARAAESDGSAEMIDLRAANAYRCRADELRGEIDEAERLADLGRAQRAQSELGAIEAELRKTIGIGGRRRSFRSAADRERLRVRKAINVSIGKIRSFDPKLARHLAASIHTGYFCSYQPASGERWTV